SIPVHAVVIVLAAALSLAWAAVRCIHALHMLQLDSYANDRLWAWLTAHPARRLFDLPSAVLPIAIMAALLGPLPEQHAATLLLGAWCIAGAALLFYRHAPSRQAKKPLVYTARAIRILAVSLLLSLILIIAGIWVGLSSFPGSVSVPLKVAAGWTLLGASFVGIQLAPLTVMLANLLLAPVQSAINRTFLRRAQQRLSTVRPRVIGVTGSYGKTSTKYLLERLLADHYKVLKTPLSYNTLMGVCRVVNEALEADHQLFVVEMGAYRRGDIRELCEFVHPSLGILTAIGPQHLERFKTIENVQSAKYELIEALPASGIAIVNNDDPRCRALADRTTHVKVLRYGLDRVGQSLDVWAENVAMGPGGLSFMMHARGAAPVEVQTVLLGRHNALNILGASCAAMALGVGLPDLAKAIRELPPVPHRLQLIRGEGGVT
ncbi:MAG: Mur ligase family protein, partial [Candidatus Entotheonellia bacterium]